MKNWKKVRVADFIEFNPRLSLKKSALATKVSMDKLQPFTKKIPATEQAEFAGGSKFCNGDTIMARITPCLENGKTAFVDILQDGEVAFGSTEFIVMRARAGISDSQFIYYLATSPAFRNVAIKSMVGSSGRQRVQQGVLDELELTVPPLEEQQKIGAFLAMLDQKIALNNEINDNLQQQAQALYRSWFIEYTPFGGTPPADWDCGKLKDILLLQKRAIKAGAAPELPYLPIDTIPMKTFAVSDFRPNEEAQSSLIRFSKDDILIGAMRVYFHRVIIAPCDGITRTTCFVLKPTDPAYLSFGLLTCDLDSSIDHAQNTSKGSTMPYAVWDGGMGEIEIAIPPLDVAREFNELVLPMLRQIQNSYYEVKALRELRDCLLPRLMSGDLDVSECF